MKNYIAEDYFQEGSSKKVYTDKETCLRKEGSVVEFDSKKVSLSTSTIADGQIIEDSAKKREADKKPLVSKAYKSMVKDIYDEMFKTFGTRNDVSAAAFASTFEAMLKRPAHYVDASLGLVDEDAVLAYAASKVKASDDYGVYRLKRIGQYQAEKAALDND